MRLTKEDRYGHFYTNKANCRNIWSLDGKKLEGEFFENQTLAIDGEAIDKLGQLEDIEEELGIDLITLFKALTNDVYLYHNEELTKCEQAPCLLCFDGDYCLEYHFDYDIEQVYLKDYGKTWALTEEELENGKEEN